MNKYKKIIWSIRFVNIIIILMTLAVIFVPVYLFKIKIAPLETVALMTDENSDYGWFLNHEKLMTASTDLADIVIINSANKFDQSFTETLKHKTVLYENLFNRLDEIGYKQALLHDATGINYTGYSGRAYPKLEDRDVIPASIIANYESETGKAWQFTGEGIIITNIEQHQTIVLRKGIEYKKTPTLSDGLRTIPYWGQFEMTSGGVNAEVNATFDLHTTAMGSNRLNGYQLSSTFPAFYTLKSQLNNAYYAAGSFSTFKVDVPYSYDWMPTVMANKQLYELFSLEQTYWQWFYPTLSSMLVTAQIEDQTRAVSDGNPFYIEGLQIYSSTTKAPFFVKGVNLGAAVPNKAFTEFPTDIETYTTWLEQIGALNVNTIRVYTLLPPTFYQALYTYNQSHEEPLYLLQEIWPEENPVDKNYLAEDYNQTYHQEIEYVVNAIHGNENIPYRDFRAYGLYQYDVSPYLLGFLVGRELEPEEVIATDELNEGYHYEGTYLYGEPEASPTENWLAYACDYALTVAFDTYGSKPLVGIVNWPTLDPIDHDSEWNDTGDKTLQFNDSAVVDINAIGTHADQLSGFFGAYHIYPNYPDFMNNDEAYNAYYDAEGRFRYGGYLNDFMSYQKKYPAVVAEYGMSTSMYTAHISPDGYNHGGVTEKEQADGIIRMTNAIIQEGYSGAIIFEWMDEWSKKTWTTEPFTIPFLNNPFWHNIIDPEQNYGLLKYVSDDRSSVKTALRPADDFITRIATSQDSEAVYITLDFTSQLEAQKDFNLKISTPSEIGLLTDYWEFLLSKTSNAAALTVNPGYNWPNGTYSASPVDPSQFLPLRQLINSENTTKSGTYTQKHYEELGAFHIGEFSENQNQISIDDQTVTIRIPYGLLGISDPSTRQILADARAFTTTLQDSIRTKEIEQIHFELDFETQSYDFDLPLKAWQEAQVSPMLKSSYEPLSDYFKTIP